MNNLQRITLVSFLAYFGLSGMLAPMGVISGPMAETFGRPITEITANFSWLTGGILVGAVLALLVYDWIRLKYVLLGVYGLIVVSLVSLPLQPGLMGIWLALGLVGTCSGIGLAGGAIVISQSYKQRRRASMLIITDGCFSVAGFVCSWLAIQLIARDVHWSGAYLFIAATACVLLGLAAFSAFPESKPEGDQQLPAREPWPIGVWLCIAALALYAISQYSLMLWLPNYAETQLGAPRERAGQIVSQFWIGMFAAQVFVAWWVFKVGVRRLAMLGTGLSAVASIPLWTYPEVEGLILFAMLLGFVNFGLLKVTISMATQMVRLPPPRMVSALLLGTTTGTTLSPWVSSQIVEATNNHVVLQISSIGYVLVAVIIFFARRLSRQGPAAAEGV